MNTIMKIREELGLKRSELAKEIGLTSRTAIYNYEIGIRVMPVKTAKKLIKLAKRHGIEIDLDYIYKDVDCNN